MATYKVIRFFFRGQGAAAKRGAEPHRRLAMAKRIDTTGYAAELATTPEGRTYLRTLAGMDCSGSLPVVLVPGNEAPHSEGTGYYYTTLSGKTVVHHPRAYKWPVRYWGSTRRVEVGERYRALTSDGE